MKIIKIENKQGFSSATVLYDKEVPNYHDREELSITDAISIGNIGKEAWKLKKEKERQSKETPGYFALGTAVHCLILEPEKFANTFRIYEGKVPTSEQQKNFATQMAEHHIVKRRNQTLGFEISTDDAIVEAFKSNYAYSKMNTEKIQIEANAKYMELTEYIHNLIELELDPRIPINNQDYDKAKNMAEAFRTSALAKQLAEDEGLLFIETELFWTHTAIKPNTKPLLMRSKLDLVWIPKVKEDEYGMPVIIDIKTTEKIGILSVEDTVKNYSYQIQSWAYREAWKQNIEWLKGTRTEDNIPVLTPEEQKAITESFLSVLIFISKSEPHEALHYELDLAEPQDYLLNWYLDLYGEEFIRSNRPKNSIPVKGSN